MRRALFATAVLSISLVGYGCAKNSNGRQPAPQAQGQEGPAWTLLVKSDCSEGEPGSCVAAEGFTISADGTYHSGASAQGGGTVKQGDEDFRNLESILDKSLNQANFSAEAPARCTAIEIDPNVITPQETITLTRKSIQKPIYRSTQEETCYQTATVEEARALHDAIMKLARTYYSMPVPNACMQSVQALEAMYPSVSACSTDSDCTYVAPSFQEILPDWNQYVTTESCDMARPMVVANLNSFVAKQSSFEKASLAVTEACAGVTRNGGNCTTKGFADSAMYKPVCAQGSCHVNPNAVIH